jgi:hypothetical protein
MFTKEKKINLPQGGNHVPLGNKGLKLPWVTTMFLGEQGYGCPREQPCFWGRKGLKLLLGAIYAFYSPRQLGCSQRVTVCLGEQGINFLKEQDKFPKKKLSQKVLKGKRQLPQGVMNFP